jgi:hypothetical protein
MFIENMGTIFTALVLLGIVTAVILKIVRDRRKGKCAGCSCGCASSNDVSDCGR